MPSAPDENTADGRQAGSAGGRRVAARDRILEAALDELALHGFHAVTMAKVAERAGLSRAGVLHHFADKTLLLRAALGHHHLRNAHAVHAVGARDPEELFQAIVRMMEFATWAPPLSAAHTILAGESVAPTHPAHDWFVQHYVTVRADFAEVLRRGIADGLVRPDIDPEAIAAQLVGLMEGLQLQWLLAGSGGAADEGAAADASGLDLPGLIADAVDRLRRDILRPAPSSP